MGGYFITHLLDRYLTYEQMFCIISLSPQVTSHWGIWFLRRVNVMEYEEAKQLEEIDERKKFYRRHIKEMADSIDELDVLIYFDNYIFKLLEIKRNEKQGN